MRIDDEEEAVVAENRHGKRIALRPDVALLEGQEGSRISLGDELVELLAAQDLVIAAPGKQITILADKIRFERG